MAGEISEDDLHAYADNRLTDARRAEVEGWLATNPQAAAEVAGWRRQNEQIRAAFPIEPAIADDAAKLGALTRSRRTRRSFLLNLAAGLAFFASGAGIGAYTMAQWPGTDHEQIALERFPQASRTNYLVYASEVRHAVEVGADEEAHLIAWLGKRVGKTLAAPSLINEGFHLVGGRLVPFDGAPGAMLMYEDGGGERLTLLIGRNEANDETGFRFETEGAVQTFYWIDGPIGYAISGKIDRSKLEKVSQAIYRQL